MVGLARERDAKEFQERPEQPVELRHLALGSEVVRRGRELTAWQARELPAALQLALEPVGEQGELALVELEIAELERQFSLEESLAQALHARQRVGGAAMRAQPWDQLSRQAEALMESAAVGAEAGLLEPQQLLERLPAK